MIYTVTLNPSIDYIVKLNELKTGSTNRVNEEYVYPGGKGINVSRILKELGNDNISLGFISGFTGEYIIRTLEEKFEDRFYKDKNGFSRINVKIKESEETEINGQGPNIDDEDIDILYKNLIS